MFMLAGFRCPRRNDENHMNTMNRREAVKLLLGGLLRTAGAVVLASAVAPAVAEADTKPAADKTPEERADEVAADMPIGADETCAVAGFRNAAFRNGGFRNGGFRNAGFRNGGFANGGFRNAGFRNGGFRNF
jgi:hypothetical protein